MKVIYSVLAVARESTAITYVLAETQRHAKEWESFIVEKRESFKYALNKDCWHRETVGGLLKSGASYVVAYMAFSNWS